MDSFDGLRGDELIEKIEELKEDDYGVQDRIYECGYVLNGEPSYKHYFQALAEAKEVKAEDILLDYFPENEIPFLAFEVAKQLKVMSFYDYLIDELNDKNIEFFKDFKIIKNFALKINYKDLYKTGFIKDYRNIEEIDETLKGPDLIKRITNKDGLLEYDTELIQECGYEIYDQNDNEYADVISFFEEVTKIKEINLDNIDLNNFDMHQIREDIQDIINTDRKYYAFDFTCFDNDDELEIFALTENIQFEVVFKNSKEANSSDINSQEFRPVEKLNNSINEKNNYLPPGKYWIGDLSYVMENYFEKHYCLVENGVYQTENGINFARFSTAYGDGFYYDYEGNQYGVDTANIGCISIDGISDEADGDLGNYHIFDYPVKCVWNEIGGYIQYGDIWIQTDTLDQFILPPYIFTLKGKALLLFGEKFLNKDECFPLIIKLQRGFYDYIQNNMLFFEETEVMDNTNTYFNPEMCKILYKVYLMDMSSRERQKTIAIDRFQGDGTTTTFGNGIGSSIDDSSTATFSVGVSDATDIMVFVGGVYQVPTTNYSISGSGTTATITFGSAPPANDGSTGGHIISVVHGLAKLGE